MVSERVPTSRNIALEAPRLEKLSLMALEKEIAMVSEGVPKSRNIALEPQRLDRSAFRENTYRSALITSDDRT
jgi:hypothetical protein